MHTHTAPTTELPPLATEEQAASFLGVKRQTLALWRSTGRHDLPYTRVGRCIRYRREHLLNWIERNTVTAG